MTIQGVKKERTFENVKRFWDETAKNNKDNPCATIRDHQFRLLEIGEIAKFIVGLNKVLDIGCGNGFSTLKYSKHVNHIVGMDYSEEFIKWANNKNSQKNVKFKVGDITNIPADDKEFDAVICERVLINLQNKNMQVKAINEMYRVLKDDGVLICVEVTEQGHENVNRIRNMFGLGDLERYWHNLYLDEKDFMRYAGNYFDISTKRFGMYHFISKVIHPLLVAPKDPSFNAKINEIARVVSEKIPDFSNCSHQVMFVMRKKS